MNTYKNIGSGKMQCLGNGKQTHDTDILIPMHYQKTYTLDRSKHNWGVPQVCIHICLANFKPAFAVPKEPYKT